MKKLQFGFEVSTLKLKVMHAYINAVMTLKMFKRNQQYTE